MNGFLYWVGFTALLLNGAFFMIVSRLAYRAWMRGEPCRYHVLGAITNAVAVAVLLWTAWMRSGT